MHNLKELKIWQKAIDLTVVVYEVTANFPKEEKYGLISQIRRAAVSMPSNISEGAGRNGTAEFVHFLGIAQGSSYELQTQLIISKQLKLISEEQLNLLLTQLDEIQKMNRGLQESLKSKV